MQFYLIYIREAHPSDGWQMRANEKQGVVFEDPETIEERRDLAIKASEGMDLTLPILVDTMHDKISMAFNGWPERLYMIDNGKIRYAGGMGPFDFKPAQLKKALQGWADGDPIPEPTEEEREEDTDE